jgi:hypothetical protein
MRNNEFKRNMGALRVKGNNEREPGNEIDPMIVDRANEILQHQERLKQRMREKYRKANVLQGKVTDDQKYRNRQMMAIYKNIDN